jgi:hypothetical protein
MVATFLSPPEAGCTPKYPWPEWLDGRIWTLTRGRDYWGDPSEFSRRLRAAAAQRRRRVEIDDSDPGHLTIRAVPSARPSHG